MAPSPKSLKSLLEACGLRLSADQLDRLWRYHRLLREANAELNLTRIHNFENMVLKHYADSLLVLNHVELPSPLVDMGSGPGLPGIPLKIARPEVTMILAEPRGARAEFLDRVVAELGLEGVEVYAGKVGPRFPRTAQGVITRAVATIAETLGLVTRVIESGGRMIFMKGPGCEDEIAEARRERAEHFRLVLDHPYGIPGTTHDRRLVVYERTAAEAAATRSGTEEPQASLITSVAYNGPVREITSAANPTFKLIRDLTTAREIRKHGLALLAGTKVVPEVLKGHPDRVEAWLSTARSAPPPGAGLLWYRLSEALFRELDTAGTHAPLLLVKVPEFPAFDPAAPWPSGCTLFVPFQDPENVGAIVRSAAAFGVPRVVLLREAAHPFHPRSLRAGGTALFQVPMEQGPSIRDLDPAAVPLIALDADGVPLGSEPFPACFGLIAGVEGPGLPPHLRSGPTRRIPIAKDVESLNAATAAAIALYAWRTSLGSGPNATPS